MGGDVSPAPQAGPVSNLVRDLGKSVPSLHAPVFPAKGQAEWVSGGAMQESQWGEVMESSPWVGSASEPQKYRYRWTMPRSTVRVCRDCHRILAAFNIINS